MSRYARQRGYIGIGKQDSKGTGVAPSKFAPWSGSPTMTPVNNYTQYKMGGDGQYPGTVMKN